jgi:hypothetical protein
MSDKNVRAPEKPLMRTFLRIDHSGVAVGGDSRNEIAPLRRVVAA